MIVHLCPRQDWEVALARGEYRAASLDREGFIHFSRPEQILAVANAFYRGIPDLVLLWVEPSKLTAELREEPVAEETFPHLYGPLNLEAVVRVTPWSPDGDGVYRALPSVPPFAP